VKFFTNSVVLFVGKLELISYSVVTGKNVGTSSSTSLGKFHQPLCELCKDAGIK
jgi:hypothetical protein